MRTTKATILKDLENLINDYYEETGLIISSIETGALEKNNLYKSSIKQIDKNIKISSIKPGVNQLDYYENDKKIRTEYK